MTKDLINGIYLYIDILPINNSKPLIPDTNMYAKFEQNPWKNTQVMDWKRSAEGGRMDRHMDRQTPEGIT